MLFNNNPWWQRATRVVTLSAMMLTGLLCLDAEDRASAALGLSIADLQLGGKNGVSAQVDVPLLNTEINVSGRTLRVDTPVLNTELHGSDLELRVDTPVLNTELKGSDLELRIDTPLLDTELKGSDLNLHVDTPLLNTELNVPDLSLRVETPVLDVGLGTAPTLPLPAPQEPRPEQGPQPEPAAAPRPSPSQLQPPRAVPNLPAPEASQATVRPADTVLLPASLHPPTPEPPLHPEQHGPMSPEQLLPPAGHSASEGSGNSSGAASSHPAVAAKGLHMQTPGGRSASYSETTADFTDWPQAPPGRPPQSPSSHLDETVHTISLNLKEEPLMKKSILNALLTIRSHDSVLDPDLPHPHPHPQHRDLPDLTELHYHERMFIKGFLDGPMSPDTCLSLTPHDGVDPWLAGQGTAGQWLH